MQEFDLVIVKAVPVKNKPKDTYRVAVKFMHGDADGYTTKTQDFPVGPDYTRESYDPSINEVLLYLKTFFDLEWNAGCEFCMGSKFRKEVLTKVGFDDEAIARCEEDFLWESDMTTDHQYRARPESVNITYFDQNGVEFVVDVFVKGTSDKLSFTRKF